MGCSSCESSTINLHGSKRKADICVQNLEVLGLEFATESRALACRCGEVDRMQQDFPEPVDVVTWLLLGSLCCPSTTSVQTKSLPTFLEGPVDVRL